MRQYRGVAETMVAPLEARPEETAGSGPGQVTRGQAGRKELTVVLVVCMGLAVAAFHSAWAHPLTTQVGPGGDADEYSWFLSWIPYALGHGLDPLLSTYVNAPQGVNLMWNTSVLLPGFLVSPLTVVFGAAFSYNLLMTAGLGLTATFSYVAFRRWTGRAPALAGALVVGFSPYMFSQANGHLAQTFLVSAPLFLIVLDRILAVQNGTVWRDGLLLGLLAWAQLLTGEEILVLEAVAAFFGVAVVTAMAGRRDLAARAPYALRSFLVGAGAFAVLSAPFLAVQFLGPDKVQNPHPPNVYVSDLWSFFVPTSVTKLAPAAALQVSQNFTGNLSEQGAYIGIPLVLFVLGTLWWARRRHLVWAAAVAGAVTAVLSLGPTLHHGGIVTSHNLPYYWFQKLPFMHNILADRFAAMTAVAVGLLVALGCEELARREVALRAGGWALACLGLVAIFPMTAFPAAGSPVYSAFVSGLSCPAHAGGAKGRPVPALVVPTINEMNLRWQAEANFCFTMPTDTGMTGTNLGDVSSQGVLLTLGEPGQGPLPTTPAVRQQAAREISQLGIHEIVVGPEWPTVPPWTPQGQAEAVAWVQWLLGKPPVQSHDPNIAYIWPDIPPANAIATGNFTGAAG
jgi:hypothetical protein